MTHGYCRVLILATVVWMGFAGVAHADYVSELPELDGLHTPEDAAWTTVTLPFPTSDLEIRGAFILADVTVDSGRVECCYEVDQPCGTITTPAEFWIEIRGTEECPDGWFTQAVLPTLTPWIGIFTYTWDNNRPCDHNFDHAASGSIDTRILLDTSQVLACVWKQMYREP